MVICLLLVGFIAGIYLLVRYTSLTPAWAVALGVYAAAFMVARAALAIAESRRIITGSTYREQGFFDVYGIYYTPEYLGDDDWLALLLLLPVAALATVGALEHKHAATRRLRTVLLVFLLPYLFISFIVALTHADEKVNSRPHFQDKELTKPVIYPNYR